MANSDSLVREVVKAASEELPPRERPIVLAGTNWEHGTGILGKEEVDDAVEPSDEPIREALTVWFPQPAPERSASLGKVSIQTRTLAGDSVRIAIKAHRKILLLDVADLIAVEAKGNYVLLSHTSGSHMLRGSISTIEEKLNLHGFVRIHRAVLVNAASVEEIHPWPTGDYVLRVRGGREFTVTRTYKKNLQLLAHLWIGTEGFASE